MIIEIKHQLSDEQRRTLLFLTGCNRVLDSRELSKDELWNLHEFFGWNKPNRPQILRLIIKRDVTITKVKV